MKYWIYIFARFSPSQSQSSNNNRRTTKRWRRRDEEKDRRSDHYYIRTYLSSISELYWTNLPHAYAWHFIFSHNSMRKCANTYARIYRVPLAARNGFADVQIRSDTGGTIAATCFDNFRLENTYESVSRLLLVVCFEQVRGSRNLGNEYAVLRGFGWMSVRDIRERLPQSICFHVIVSVVSRVALRIREYVSVLRVCRRCDCYWRWWQWCWKRTTLYCSQSHMHSTSCRMTLCWLVDWVRAFESDVPMISCIWF